MRCPVCKVETTWKGNAYRPFCSERCQLLDLDNWFSERYRIAAAADSEDESVEGVAPPVTEENCG